MSSETFPAAAFIPQRSPFVMVDQLLHADENGSVCSFHIPGNHLFVRNGYYSTPGMVESMAQTAAAGTGYLYQKENKPVPVGYIGAVQHLKVLEWPPAGSDIRMEISLVTKVLQVTLVSARVKYQNKTIASCEMKIFINPQI